MYCSKCGANIPDAAAFCNACGQSTGAVPSVPSAGVSGGGYGSAVVTAPAAVAAPSVKYAGFWLRVVAAIIDGILLGIPFAAIFFVMIAGHLPFLMHAAQEDPMTIMFTMLPTFLAFAAICLVGSWIYWAALESSSWQATLGKKALGLYVTDLQGSRATFGRTSGRFFAGRGIGMVPYIGGLYFIISCILAGITEKKQALHDAIAGCLVLRKV